LTEQFDYDATLAEIRKIQQSNRDKVNSLNAAGASIDPGALANIKIDTFIDMLDKNSQAKYVLAMEKNFQESLDDTLKLIRQQQIMQGVHKSGLTIPRG
jgi:hypothetical protein